MTGVPAPGGPTAVTRLLVWRHGLTEWNSQNRVQGHADTDLHETGVAQAERAAPLLAAYQPDVIISSDLRRAARTAAALAAITGLDVKYDNRLRERAFGRWQGMLITEVAERYPDDYARWRHGDAVLDPGIESLEDLTRRGTAALHDAADLVGTGTAVVVSHGGTARAACAGLLGWPRDVARTIGGLDNCHFAELRHGSRGWRLHGYNLGWPDAQPGAGR